MLKEKIKNKVALFIPVISMRDYATGLYKLNCDGNIARILSMVYQSDIILAYITVPVYEKIDKDDFRELQLKLIDKGIKNKVTFIYSGLYGDNAAETRRSNHNVNFLFDVISPESIDIIIVEPQGITKQLINSSLIDNEKLIYWCVASETKYHSPWFTREFKEDDKFISGIIATACATDSQVEYFGEKAYKEEFYNPKFSDSKIIFFPFRLSDQSYQSGLFIEMICRLKSEGIKNFKVLITDPNQSCIEVPDAIIVQSDHSIYTAILKGKPIIPYFENADEVKHISIEEFCMYKCEVICYDNREIAYGDNIHQVPNDECFYRELKKLITN